MFPLEMRDVWFSHFSVAFFISYLTASRTVFFLAIVVFISSEKSESRTVQFQLQRVPSLKSWGDLLLWSNGPRLSAWEKTASNAAKDSQEFADSILIDCITGLFEVNPKRLHCKLANCEQIYTTFLSNCLTNMEIETTTVNNSWCHRYLCYTRKWWERG